MGRESERTELGRLLKQTARGQGALVMIGGEPGVGKTRLAEELLSGLWIPATTAAGWAKSEPGRCRARVYDGLG